MDAVNAPLYAGPLHYHPVHKCLACKVYYCAGNMVYSAPMGTFGRWDTADEHSHWTYPLLHDPEEDLVHMCIPCFRLMIAARLNAHGYDPGRDTVLSMYERAQLYKILKKRSCQDMIPYMNMISAVSETSFYWPGWLEAACQYRDIVDEMFQLRSTHRMLAEIHATYRHSGWTPPASNQGSEVENAPNIEDLN